MNQKKFKEGLFGIALGILILIGIYAVFTIFTGKLFTAFFLFAIFEYGVLLFGLFAIVWGLFHLIQGVIQKNPFSDYIRNTDIRKNAESLFDEVRSWDIQNISFDLMKKATVMQVNGKTFGFFIPEREFFRLAYFDDKGKKIYCNIRTVEDLNYHKPLLKQSFDRIKMKCSEPRRLTGSPFPPSSHLP
jgi:hypothetical protein